MSLLKTFSSFAPFLALGCGVCAGLYPSPLLLKVTKELGELFIKLLRLLSAPMVFLAILSTLTQMGQVKTMQLMARKVLKYTLLTTLLAAIIGLGLFLLFSPSGHPRAEGGALPSAIHTTSYWAVCKTMIPENFLTPFLENQVLALALLAAALGLALRSLPEEKTREVRAVFQTLFDALLILTSKVMLIIPLAIFGFTTELIANIRADALSFRPLFWYAACIITANLLQGFFVLPWLLKIKNQSPIRLAKGMLPALTIAFLSKSSSVALPVSLQCASKRLRISEKTARFSFPLCSVINMNGCATSNRVSRQQTNF